MTHEEATRRFLWIFLPAIFFYATCSNGIVWLGKTTILPPAILYGLALVPAIAVLVAFWAQWRFATEIDEFLRLIQIKGTLFGVACVMVIASVWGTLENLTDAPNLPVFWLLPTFWLMQSLATVVISKRQAVF